MDFCKASDFVPDDIWSHNKARELWDEFKTLTELQSDR